MPPFVVIVVWLAIASAMIVSGIVLTVRRSAIVEQDYKWVNDVVEGMAVEQCSYCNNWTIDSLGVTQDGQTYDPVCLACQHRTGIRCPDGTMNPEYFYQVEPLA